jgi:hypothetical protein
LRTNKHETVAVKEASRQTAIALKKASKIYQQRLEHFTGDIEHLTSQIRDQVSITFFPNDAFYEPSLCS